MTIGVAIFLIFIILLGVGLALLSAEQLSSNSGWGLLWLPIGLFFAWVGIERGFNLL